MKGGLYKMAIILSVSVDKEQAEFLKETKMSPSSILQRSINELMARQEVSKEYVQGLQANIKRLQNILTRQGEFIQKKGLAADFLETENVFS
jgi:hypothetical protein